MSGPIPNSPRLTETDLVLAGAVSLCAVGAGVLTCLVGDVPATVWTRNIGAWVVGGFAAILLSRAGPRTIGALLPLAAVLLAGTFLGPEQSGVHRWLGLGPMSLNAAMLALPAAIIPLARFGGRYRWPWLVALACLALLVAQPDRSQAAAFGAAVIWLAVGVIRGRTMQVAVAAAAVAMVVGAFLRPDPLEPVPEVEGILHLALAVFPPMAMAGAISLLIFSALPAWMMRHEPPDGRRMGEALSVYFLVSAAMPFVGAYPVPLVGMGVSPILGSWLAMGALLAARSLVGKGERGAE